jgi:uncharacterized protein (TIGR02453 family)
MGMFKGFRPELIEFLRELRDNNSRDWFQAHRAQYEDSLLQPAREFVLAMGERLQALGSDIHAEPRVHGSIFAINRDTRFSADKTPYKTHLDLWFWQSNRPGLNRESPGYFFRLTPENLILGAGMHAFSANGALERFRQAVLDDVAGQRLDDAVRQTGHQAVGGRTYKRVPRGLPQQHPRANWLRHSGLFVQTQQPVPPDLFTPNLPQLCTDQFERFAPVQRWLVDLLAN